MEKAVTAEQQWSVVFYTEESGREPVREFLESLDAKTQARVIWAIEQLKIRNVQAREPLAKHVEGDLWELRVESSRSIYRVFYAFFSGKRIVFLHGFQKKTGKTPRGEIAMAHRRLAQFRRMVREAESESTK